MPELPDVEVERRSFARHGAGRRVERAVVFDPVSVRNATPEALDDALRGRTFAEPERHGKWLVCPTDGPTLLVHFGMTGELVSSRDEPARHRWDRVILELDDGSELRYRNMRKLGGVWLAHDERQADGVVGRLGPDALSVGRAELLERLRRRRGGVKAALMDQSFVAGVGNLVADEVLWQARLHPRRRIETLADEERARLVRTLRSVLREWVDRYDAVARKRSWLYPIRGLPGSACPRCRTSLERITAAGRTTWLCPSCQPTRSIEHRSAGARIPR